MKRRFIAILLAAAPMVATCGCGKGALTSACVEANAIVASVGAYLDEAQFAIDRARALAKALPAEIQGDALKAVEAAEAALFVVSKAAATASAQCRQLDIPDLFRDFAVLWDAVKALLDVFGGEQAGGLIDPQAYELGKGS